MSTTTSHQKITASENNIDALLSLASPYVSEFNDDIPILDILIGAGSKPGYFKASVAIYLDDETLKASSEHLSPNAALNRAIVYVATKVTLHEQSKKHFQKLVRKAMHTTQAKETQSVYR